MGGELRQRLRETSLALRPISSAGEAEKLAAWHGGGGAVHIWIEVVELGAVAAELRLIGKGVVQAGEVGRECGARRRNEGIDAPCAALFGGDHAVAAEVGEVAGDSRLREVKHGFEVADAERTLRQQVDKAQASGVAKAVVDPEQFHAAKLGADCRIRQGKYGSTPERRAMVTLKKV